MLDDYIPYIMVGTWLAVVVFFLLWGRRRVRREAEYRRALFQGPGEWRRVNLGDFPDCDEDYFAREQEVLEANGFSYVGDVEDVKLAGTYLNPRSPQRVMLSSDGRVVAVVWRLYYSFWERVYYRLSHKPLWAGCFRIYAEAEDGRVYQILAVPRWRRLEEPASIRVRYVGQKGGVGGGWVIFRGDFGEFLQGDGTFRPRCFKTLAEVLAGEERMRGLRVAYRQKAGWLTLGELADQGMVGGQAERYLKLFNKMAGMGK